MDFENISIFFQKIFCEFQKRFENYFPMEQEEKRKKEEQIKDKYKINGGKLK